MFEVLFADDGKTRSSFEKCSGGCWVGLGWRSEGLDLASGERPLRLPQLGCFASCHPWRWPSPVVVQYRRGQGGLPPAHKASLPRARVPTSWLGTLFTHTSRSPPPVAFTKFCFLSELWTSSPYTPPCLHVCSLCFVLF